MTNYDRDIEMPPEWPVWLFIICLFIGVLVASNWNKFLAIVFYVDIKFLELLSKIFY